jgi:hypothetical protein
MILVANITSPLKLNQPIGIAQLSESSPLWQVPELLIAKKVSVYDPVGLVIWGLLSISCKKRLIK